MTKEQLIVIQLGEYLKMIDKNHEIVDGRVCCVGHCCYLHYYTEEEYNQEIKEKGVK